MPPKFLSALETRELINCLPSEKMEYWAALRLRLLNGYVSAYSSSRVITQDGERHIFDEKPIIAEAWSLFFSKSGSDMLWPTADMSVIFDAEGSRPQNCDYLGVFFYYEDLADFLPIEPYRDPPLTAAQLAELLPSRPNIVPPAESEKPRSRRGRPRSDFWDMMTVEVARRIYAGDIKPPIKANIVRNDLLSWLAEKGETPDRTTVDSFFADLETALNTEHYNNNSG